MKWRSSRAKVGTKIAAGLIVLASSAVLSNLVIPLEPRASFGPQDGGRVMQLSPDSMTLVTTTGTGADFGRGPIQVWDVHTGYKRFECVGDWTDIETVAFSLDGKLLAAHQREGDLRVWNVMTGRQLMSVTPPVRLGNMVGFRFSPEGDFLIVQHFGADWPTKQAVTFWDIGSGQEWAVVDTAIGCLEFVDSGKSFITWKMNIAEGKVTGLKVWNIGTERNRLACVIQYELSVDDLAISPDGKSFVSVTNGNAPDASATIELRDIETGLTRRTLARGVKRCICGVSFSPNGDLLLLRSRSERPSEAQTTLWDMKRTPIQELGSFPDDAIFSPDNNWFALPAGDRAELYRLPKLTKTIVAHSDDVQRLSNTVWNGARTLHRTNVTFSADSKTLAVSGLHQDEREPKIVKWFSEHIYGLRSHADEGMVRFWDVETGQEIATLAHADNAQFAADGKSVATIGSDGSVRLWDVPFRKPRGKTLALALVFWALLFLVFEIVFRFYRFLMGRRRGNPAAGKG